MFALPRSTASACPLLDGTWFQSDTFTLVSGSPPWVINSTSSPSFANKPSSNAMSQSKPLYTLGRSILIFGKVITSPLLSVIYHADGAKEKCNYGHVTEIRQRRSPRPV